MAEEIENFKKAGADGFVFGVLNEEGRVDRKSCDTLMRAAEGRGCTFHRAFDEILEEYMQEELEVLIDLGFENVLTSGGAKTAMEGREVLKRLVQSARGRIQIIVGGGVRSGNVNTLREIVGMWFHSSAIVDVGDIACKKEVKELVELLKAEIVNTK